MKNTKRGRLPFVLAVLCILIAIGFHLYLFKHHIDIKLGASGENSVCNVSEVLNCDTAASSSYSEVFGIPIAMLGAFANGLLLLLLVIAYFNWSEDSERTERYAFYLAGMIFAVSLIMGSISLFILKSGCPFCIGTYLLSLIVLISLWFAFRPALTFAGDDVGALFTEQRWLLVMLAGVALASLLVNNMVLDSYGYQRVREVIDSSYAEWTSSPTLDFDLSTGLAYQKGDGVPKVVIVEFADYLCPHCRHAYPVLQSFTKNHGDVKLIYKPFPLDGVCNSAMQGKRDGKSCDLAYAVLCTEKIAKKGWEAHHYIFDNQETIFSTPMNQVTEDICKNTGADCAQLKACMNSEEIHEVVRKTAAEGEKAKIAGTPAIFYNNKLLPGGQLLPVLENVYKQSR
jgi:protein-disulfide isomerase/uncharacterized membrane protein